MAKLNILETIGPKLFQKSHYIFHYAIKIIYKIILRISWLYFRIKILKFN